MSGGKLGRVYLASRYSRHVEMQGYADDLRAAGFTVEVEWIKGEHRMADASDDFDGSGARFALDDWRDLAAADTVISFTGSGGRGGRHVEFGMAIAWGKRCLIVGPRENVFHWLPEVEQFDTWPEALAVLSPILPARPAEEVSVDG